jgi:hypothetical protein
MKGKEREGREERREGGKMGWRKRGREKSPGISFARIVHGSSLLAFYLPPHHSRTR